MLRIFVVKSTRKRDSRRITLSSSFVSLKSKASQPYRLFRLQIQELVRIRAFYYWYAFLNVRSVFVFLFFIVRKTSKFYPIIFAILPNFVGQDASKIRVLVYSLSLFLAKRIMSSNSQRLSLLFIASPHFDVLLLFFFLLPRFT